MDSAYSRRRFIQKYFLQTVTFLGIGFALNSCDQKQSTPKPDKAVAGAESCNNLSGLSEKDIDVRKKLGYVNKSPIADSTCGKCKLWLPRAEDKTCGGCMLFKGPVEPGGYCTYWAAPDA